jgi:hypothetical protein
VIGRPAAAGWGRPTSGIDRPPSLDSGEIASTVAEGPADAPDHRGGDLGDGDLGDGDARHAYFAGSPERARSG